MALNALSALLSASAYLPPVGRCTGVSRTDTRGVSISTGLYGQAVSVSMAVNPGKMAVPRTAMVVSRTKAGYRSTKRVKRRAGLHPLNSGIKTITAVIRTATMIFFIHGVRTRCNLFI